MVRIFSMLLETYAQYFSLLIFFPFSFFKSKAQISQFWVHNLILKRNNDKGNIDLKSFPDNLNTNLLIRICGLQFIQRLQGIE